MKRERRDRRERGESEREREREPEEEKGLKRVGRKRKAVVWVENGGQSGNVMECNEETGTCFGGTKHSGMTSTVDSRRSTLAV